MAQDVQPKGRRGGRNEPRGGWPLGVKTTAPPVTGPDPEVSAEEAARQGAVDAAEAKRRSDQMARRDESDVALDEHHVQEGKPAFKRRSGGNEPRTPFGGDPAEERRIAGRAAGGESPSAWVQDTRAPHYRESWDEQQAARLQNEGEAADRELRKAVRGGLSELVRVRTVVLGDRLAPSAAELERLERRPRLDDDGRRANRRDRAQVVDDGLPLVPPLGASLAHAEADPALLALAAGKYPGSVLEPSLDPEWLKGLGHEDTAGNAQGAIERALDDVEAACMDRWRNDPARAEALERRWERERDQLWDAASQCDAPEETRLLVEGMRVYGAELAEKGRGFCYVERVHTAVGRDREVSPLPGEAVGPAIDAHPDLVASIRVVDPDSPLCVVPAGVSPEEYGRVLAGALDAARAPVAAAAREAAPLDPPVVRARVLADVAGAFAGPERVPDRAPEARSGPSSAELGASVRLREQRELLECAGQGFRDLSEALADRGVFFEVGPNPGDVREMSAGVVVEVSAGAFGTVSERGRDAELFEGPVPVGAPPAQRAAVADALRGAAEAHSRQDPRLPDGAAERFGERMAARLFEHPVPIPSLVSSEVEQVVSNMVSQIGAEASALAAARRERIEARDAAVERFEKVFDAVSGRVTVTVRDLLADPDGSVGFTVRRDPASKQISAEVLVDPRLRHGDRSLTNEKLAERHGEAYVDLGRALGEGDPERAGDWSKVYGALASAAGDGRPVTVSVGSCAANRSQREALAGVKALAEALREQVRADGFATEQMKQAWPRKWRHETPRVVEREDGVVRIAQARIGGLGPPKTVAEVLERDGKLLAKDIQRSVKRVDRLVRDADKPARQGPSLTGGVETPPRAPAPVVDPSRGRERGPRNQQDVLDGKLSVTR